MYLEGLLRIKQALELIEQRLEGRLSIDEIAKAACVSPFHFQRMFLILTGMTVAEYTRKRKLTLAAQELATTSSKVIDVALKYGYDSPESFTKAFRKIHGVPPSEARRPGIRLKAFPRISFHLSLKGDQDMDYKMIDKEAFNVIGMPIEVKCDDKGQISRFWQECHQNGSIGKLSSLGNGGNFLGACMNMQPETGDFTYMIAVPTDLNASVEGFSLATIPRSTWAVFNAVGPVPGAIQHVFERIFQEWFPATGYEVASDVPELEVYSPGDISAEDYLCEIWIPINRK
ncbi:AraC family transcriptional regulator [Paenibacillus woosongensis]|uniref:AraC family transcriptional regulator n=1 Tax=Paenibacillus woosongensis TaxID=307580 RepID=A0AA95I7J7_9BACL|nr:AraC family transcriptional regulator [Paenibacillus woosongensis]WHX48934.1 AraC family transcriptional regulator [Paenibacillus woosongensis]